MLRREPTPANLRWFLRRGAVYNKGNRDVPEAKQLAISILEDFKETERQRDKERGNNYNG